MGSSDVDKSCIEPKKEKPKTPVPQNFLEQDSAAYGTVAADWYGFQAYSPMPLRGYVASSPHGHSYMWPVPQFVPSYGTPPSPYVAVYPHGGIYPHLTMAPGSYPFSPFAMPAPSGNAEAFANLPVENDGWLPEGKKKLPIKRSKGSLGSLTMITAKSKTDIASTASASDVYCKSDESASGGSSDGSEEILQNSGSGVYSAKPSLNGGAAHSSQNGRPNPALYQGPVTCAPGHVNGETPVIGTCDSVQSQPWIQDEREQKRQRRKQANRESARRSRLRKEAEYDELAQRSEALNEEKASLRAEIARIRCDYVQLLAQNAALKERLGEEADRNCSLELDGL